MKKLSPHRRAALELQQTLMRTEKKIRKNSGQMMIVFALTWAIFVGGMVVVFNTGIMVGERVRIQQIADNAAYSGAVWEARCFNFTAYANRAIVADLAFLAYLTAMQSHLEAWAMLIDYLATAASFIPYVGAIVNQILSTVSDVIEELSEAVGDVKDSSLWEAVMDSLYYSQQAMFIYTMATLSGIMQEVATDADPSVQVDGLVTPINGFNINTFMAMYEDAQGEGDDLQWLTEQTISSWTKGTDDGIVPFANREWMLIPSSVERNVLRYVSAFTGLPSNFGIWGNINVDNQGVDSLDYVYTAWWYWSFSWRRPPRLRRAQVPISIYFRAEREIDWDDIGFYKYDPDGPEASGVWAIATKPAGAMNSFIYRSVLAAPFAGTANTLVVPQKDISAISKAVARYVDPQPTSSRHSTLVSQGREPNLFNPFWTAELVPTNHSQQGPGPDEDESKGAIEAYLQTRFETYGMGDLWRWKVRH